MAHVSKDIDKPTVIYLGPEDNRKEFACGGCMMFIKQTSECTIVEDSKVDGVKGGCNLWVGGKSVEKRADHPPMEIVTKEKVGYSDQGPFTCKRCKNFVPMGDYGGCKIVEGTVHKDGCCNAWESNPFYNIEQIKF